VERMNWMVTSMDSILKILQNIIPVLVKIGTGPIGWISAGIQLIKMLVREKFDDKIKVLKMIT
jgi:hypothetical protein